MTECEWCGDTTPSPRPKYCSHNCEAAALRHAANVVAAFKNGEEPPSKPDATPGDPEVERWTPARMQGRIDRFKREAGR